jgi:hypothetical protein
VLNGFVLLKKSGFLFLTKKVFHLNIETSDVTISKKLPLLMFTASQGPQTLELGSECSVPNGIVMPTLL